MARYFFDIYDGEDVFGDTGTDLNSMNEMHIRMLAPAKNWIEREEHQHTHWSVEARDEEENIVGSVRFGIVADNGHA